MSTTPIYSGMVKTYRKASFAGNTSEFVVLTNKMKQFVIEIICVYVRLSSDANAANRQVNMIIRDEKETAVSSIYSPIQTASKEVRHNFAKGLMSYDATLATYNPLPKNLLYPNETLSFSVTNGLVGDIVYNLNVQFRLAKVATE